MKKLLLSGVAFADLAMGPAIVPVMAADLSAPIYKALPPPAPAFSWSGCYIGGTVGGGYAWSQNTNTVNTTAFGDFGPTQGFAQPTSGFAGGGCFATGLAGAIAGFAVGGGAAGLPATGLAGTLIGSGLEASCSAISFRACLAPATSAVSIAPSSLASSSALALL